MPSRLNEIENKVCFHVLRVKWADIRYRASVQEAGVPVKLAGPNSGRTCCAKNMAELPGRSAT